MAYRAVLAVSLLSITMACEGCGGSTGCAADNAMTVAGLVDGEAYCGEVDNVLVSPGNINVASSNAASTVSVNFGFGAAVGTTMVGQNVPLSFQVETPSGVGTAAEMVGSGSLTVVTLTSTTAAGTFNCVAQPVAGGTASRVVTNGSFRVTLPPM